MGEAQDTGSPEAGGAVNRTLRWVDSLEHVRAAWVVRNATPKRLVITGRDGVTIELAPLERRRISEHEEKCLDLPALKRSRLVQITPTTKRNINVVAGLSFYGVVGYLLLGWAWSSSWRDYWPVAGLLLGLGIGTAILTRVLGWSEMWLRLKQGLSFLVVLAIATVIPAIALGIGPFVVGSGDPDARGSTLLDVVLEAHPVVFQWLLLATASLFPSALFFLFDRMRLAELREQIVRVLLRLDPRQKTLCDLEAEYGDRLDEAFGPPTDDSRTTLSGGRRSPVVLFTLLICLGWVVGVVQPESTRDLLTIAGDEAAPTAADASPDGAQEAVRSEESDAPGGPGAGSGKPGQPHSVMSLMLPHANFTSFAFLGAYVFSLFVIVLGYVRRDLRPKTYGQLSVRIVLAFVVGLIVDKMPFATDSTVWAIAFVGGMLPKWFFEQIIQTVRTSTFLRAYIPSLAQGSRLTELDGLDVFDQTRLYDEGVTNVESLANADLVGLLIETRISPAQLVGWVDQASLYSVTQNAEAVASVDGGDEEAADRDDEGESASAAPEAAKAKSAPAAAQEPSLWRQLRRRGIATASAFLGTPHDEVMQALGVATDDGAVATQLKIVRARLERAEWLRGIRSWCATRSAEPGVLKLRAIPTDEAPVEDAPAAPRTDDVQASHLRLRPARPAERDGERADPAVTDAAQ